MILSWKNLPFDGAFTHLSNVVLVAPGIEYDLPFDNLIVMILFGRLYVKSVIQADSTGFSHNISDAFISIFIITDGGKCGGR